MNIFLKSTTVAFLAMPLIANATEITNTQITSTGVKVVVDLDSNLKTGEKVKIDYGKGLKAMTCKNKSCLVTFTAAALPKNTMKLDYNIGIYNNDVLLDGTLKNGTVDFEISKASTALDKVNTASKPTITSSGKGDIETFVSGSKTFSYTKIANDGSELPKTAQLGTGAKDWACTQDNNTGLIWEVKTRDRGLRDVNKSYTWSEGFDFAKSVNTQTLCGANDWRMPTEHELRKLFYCSDDQYGSYNRGDCINHDTVTHPTINTTYFPNTPDSNFWSSSPMNSSRGNDYVYVVDFDGNVDKPYHEQRENYYVRLVR